MYTQYELDNFTKEQLITLVLSMQETTMRGEKIVSYYNRDTSNSKYASITPDMVAAWHIDGYSLSEIRDKIKREKNIDISIQVLTYKIRKYERENRVNIYRSGKKGRRKVETSSKI